MSGLADAVLASPHVSPLTLSPLSSLFTNYYCTAINMQAPLELPLRILSHNIRFATSSLFKGERPWSDRKQPLVNELLYNTRHLDAFICLQEVLHSQLVGILSGVNHGSQEQEQSWAYIGVGRDDGKEAGEYSPILYRPAVWHLRHWETIWLSQTPAVPSKGWDASSIRIATIGIFTHCASRQTVLAMNTHLDDQGSHSRFEAARMILQKVHEYKDGGWGSLISGVFLSGDLNSEEYQEAYQVFTAANSPLKDSAKLVDSKEHYGDRTTWTGFGHEPEPPSRLDYIFLDQSWKVQGYAVLPNRSDGGLFNSDHRAVVTDAVLQ